MLGVPLEIQLTSPDQAWSFSGIQTAFAVTRDPDSIEWDILELGGELLRVDAFDPEILSALRGLACSDEVGLRLHRRLEPRSDGTPWISLSLSAWCDDSWFETLAEAGGTRATTTLNRNRMDRCSGPPCQHGETRSPRETRVEGVEDTHIAEGSRPHAEPRAGPRSVRPVEELLPWLGTGVLQATGTRSREHRAVASRCAHERSPSRGARRSGYPAAPPPRRGRLSRRPPRPGSTPPPRGGGRDPGSSPRTHPRRSPGPASRSARPPRPRAPSRRPRPPASPRCGRS